MMRRSLSPELASLKANQANRDRENRGLRADERRNGGPSEKVAAGWREPHAIAAFTASGDHAFVPPPLKPMAKPVGKPLFSLHWMGGGVGYRTFDSENHFVGAHLADETLLEQDFYHGILTRYEVEERVTRDGEFLVCIPNEQPHNQFVIAIATRFLYELRFFVVKKAPSGFHVHEKVFASIPQLVEHYVKQRESLDQQLPVLIHTAVPVPDWVITHDRVWLEDMIGTVPKGVVFTAQLACGRDFKPVAVKQLRGKSTRIPQRRAELLQEARKMRELHHPNLVNFLGIAAQQEPLLMVLEFCPGGSLLKYLRTNGAQLDAETRLSFAVEAAAGLRYLESRQCVHRNIAALNCLLSEKSECKIADFGLSIKDASAEGDSFGEPTANSRLPVKWLAPESIRTGEFSHKSDVWSFGVLLYEIFSNGAEPYPKISAADVRSALAGDSGFRMELPAEIPAKVVSIIEECWNETPHQRPSFLELHGDLKELKF